MSKYVVSANYVDRESPFKWLVRLANDKAENALPYKYVTAQGVTFGDSTEYESGFGCSRVAFCEEVEMSDIIAPQIVEFQEPNGGFIDSILNFIFGGAKNATTKGETRRLAFDGFDFADKESYDAYVEDDDLKILDYTKFDAVSTLYLRADGSMYYVA